MRLLLSLTLITSMLTLQIKSETNAATHFESIAKCVSICAQDPKNKERVENAVCEMVTSVINLIDTARKDGINLSAQDCQEILNKLDNTHRTALLKVFEEDVVKRAPEAEKDCKEALRKEDIKRSPQEDSKRKKELTRSPEDDKDTERGCCKNKCKNNCNTNNNCNSCCRTDEEEKKNGGGDCGGGSCNADQIKRSPECTEKKEDTRKADCKDGVCTIKRSPESEKDCKEALRKEDIKRSPQEDSKKKKELTRSPEGEKDTERGCCKKLKCKCTSCTGSTCTGCCCK